MNSQTLTFLGRDSGFGFKNNSAFFVDNNNLFLIDCGFTVFQEIKNKLDLNKYECIFIIITHLHNDHAGSLSQLLLYLWFVLNKKATIVSSCKNIKTYLDITGTPSDSYYLKNNLNVYDLKFIETMHSPYLDCYGFSMTIKDRNIVYTGDTSTLNPFIKYLNDCDELYIDVSKSGGVHIKIDDILDNLINLNNNGTNIYCMHMDDKDYIKNKTNNLFNYE